MLLPLGSAVIEDRLKPLVKYAPESNSLPKEAE
jgi:hypothetical protein